jgi:peptidoglycan/xylan/chitin deacetylase (PgdA/CDA1 family)
MSQLLSRTGLAGATSPALNFAARTLWHLPRPYTMAGLFGPRPLVRCVLFHHISDVESPFTNGLNITNTRQGFEAALTFLTRYYTPVSLQDVIGGGDASRRLPAHPVLVTFDDAYASVSEFAAPLCFEYGVPAVFFVNGAFVDNKQLALDNLVCYVFNVCGVNTIKKAAKVASGSDDFEICSVKQVISRLLPTMPLTVRSAFRRTLIELARLDEGNLAVEARLYVSSQQLRDLGTFNVELGNHTYSHMHCRSLSVGDFTDEIDRNKMLLETISGSRVRSFSVPYGSSTDLTGELATHLRHSGHEAIFLAEGSAGSSRFQAAMPDRVSIKASADAALFSEIEVLPRLRTIRKKLGLISGVGHRG